MKYKTFGRIFSGTVAAGMTTGVYGILNILNNVEYQKTIEYFNGDISFEKIGFAAYLATASIMVPIAASEAIFSTRNLIKGNSFQTELEIWKKITKNKKRKEEIEKCLENIISFKDKDLKKIPYP